MRIIIVAGCLALSTAMARAEVPKFVNLDTPGAFEALKRDNPDHFRRVIGVIEASTEMSCRTATFGELVRAKYDVANVGCGGLLIQTVYPAKGDLGFEIGSTRYSVTITILSDEKLVPVKYEQSGR